MDALHVEPEWYLRLSLDDYHRLIDLAYFDEDTHAELLEGHLVAMSPESPLHARIITFLTAVFNDARRDGQEVRPRMPLTLARSEPEPDLAVVLPAHHGSRHPTTALLVVEVSGEDSLRKDRTLKAALYAEASVAEYWVVDTVNACVRVHRDPDPAAREYRTQLVLGAGESLTPGPVPQVTIPVERLFEGR